MKVNTDELQRQAAQLRNLSVRLNNIQDSVLQVSRVLSQESIGEKFRQPLRKAAENINRRSAELDRMRAALRQIAQMYEETELRIVDETEHATVRYPDSIVGEIHLPPMVGPGGRLSVPIPELEQFTGMIDWTPWDP